MRVSRIYDPFPEWTHKPVKKTTDGKYFSPFVDEMTEPVLFQIPRTYLQSDLVDANGVKERFVDLVLSDEFEPLSTFFSNVDRAVVFYVKQHREELFPARKELDDSHIDSRFSSSLTPTNDEAKKLLKCRTFMDMKVYSYDREEIPFQLTEEQRTCDAIIRLKGVWFTKHRFGATWELYQLRVRQEENPKIMGYKFRDEDIFDEESDDDYAAF